MTKEIIISDQCGLCYEFFTRTSYQEFILYCDRGQITVGVCELCLKKVGKEERKILFTRLENTNIQLTKGRKLLI